MTIDDLAVLRAENEAAWRRDTHLSDYASVVVTATAKYLPALEAEVERLRAVAARCSRAEARIEELEEELRSVHAPDDFEDI